MSKSTEIRLFHTNDIHSHVENWPRLRRYILNQRKYYDKLGIPTLAFDIGDFVDRFFSLTEATDGKAMIDLMNQVHYDGATIGNNEGVGNTHEQLEHLYDQSNFPIILGNLYEKETDERPTWCQPYHIYQLNEQLKIGVIGLTAAFPLTYEPNGWFIQQPEASLEALLPEVSQQVDTIVLLSHLGIDLDKRIAKKYPEIQLIIGGHTHHLLEKGLLVNQTMLTASGRYGQYVGEIKLQFEDQQLISIVPKVVPVEDIIEKKKDEQEIDHYALWGAEILKNQIFATIPTTLGINPREKPSLIQVTLEAIKAKANVDAAILNSGLFLFPFPKGNVNRYELHRSLPHPMHLLKVTLSGSDLYRLIQEIERMRDYLKGYRVFGLGFRGKYFGEICYSGIMYNKTEECWYFGKEPIKDDQQYTFVTVDHLMFLPFFPTIEIAGDNQLLFPWFIRNVLEEYMQEHYPRV